MESPKIKFTIAKKIKKSNIQCPLCGGDVFHIQVNSGDGPNPHQSFIWGCNDCPMVMIEFYDERDTQALDYLLNRPR